MVLRLLHSRLTIPASGGDYNIKQHSPKSKKISMPHFRCPGNPIPCCLSWFSHVFSIKTLEFQFVKGYVVLEFLAGLFRDFSLEE